MNTKGQFEAVSLSSLFARVAITLILLTTSCTCASANGSTVSSIQIEERDESLQHRKMTLNQPAIMKRVFGVDRNIEDADFPTEDEINTIEANVFGSVPCEHGWFPSVYEEKLLHYRKWIPKSINGTVTKPKAIVIFMHGALTHAVKYVVPVPTNTTPVTTRTVSTLLMLESLLNDNIAVYAYDQYGHGYSEGVRFYIPDSYQTNVQDYITFCKSIVSVDNTVNEQWNVPIFLLAESYGSTLTLHVTKYFQDNPTELPNLKSIIVTAAAVIGDIPPPLVLRTLTFLGRFFPQWRPFFMPNPVSPDRIWRDPAVLQQYMDRSLPQNIVDGSGVPYRLGTGVELLNALEDVRNLIIPFISTPILIIHGTEDFAVPISGSELLYEKCISTDKTFIRKENAYHDLFADYVGEECITDILLWINERIV